jgi:amino acid transporter
LGGFGSIGFVVTAVPFALLIYDGAYDVVALAEDMKEPRRTLPFALFAGLAISFVLFSVLGAALLVVQGYGVASGDVVAVFRGLGTAFGPGVERAFLFAYTLVGFGGTTAILLGASRYAFGAARDGHFLAIVGRLHPRRKTPTAALFLVYLLCVGYALAAGINGLISFYVSALAALSLLAIAALLRLRRMGVGAQDHFRAPGGTALPLAWGAVTLLVITASLWDSASQIGIAGAVGLFVLLGLAFPVLALTRRRPERGRSVSLPIQGSGGSPPPAPEMGAD